MNVTVNVFNQSSVKRLPKSRIKRIVSNIIECESPTVNKVNIIFTDPEFMLEMNSKYLVHNFVTDVISFDGDSEMPAEIYICAEKAIEQAREYGVTTGNEALRLAIHGTLHVCGYDDDTDLKRLEMSRVEDYYLELTK